MSHVLDVEPRKQALDKVGERPVMVAAWHERARQLGLREQFCPDFSAVSKAELARLAEQHRSLYLHAVPVMEVLHRQIRNSHSMVVLTDSSGLILHSLGDADFREKADRVALRPGVSWSENCKGTNAIGTALTDRRPTVVHGSEHFLTANRFLTCSCSPIRDPQGRVIGALDVSGAKEIYHPHTMGLVRLSIQLIESHLFVDRFGEMVRIHFHARPEFLGTIDEGIVAFDESGRFVAANRTAHSLLGLGPEVLPTQTLSSLFGITLTGLIDRSRTANPGSLNLCLSNGVAVTARASLCAPATRVHGSLPPVCREESPEARATAAIPQGKGLLALEDLKTGDPAVAHVIERVRKVLRHGISILILGETGTGKELLAQAIHNDSHRRTKPFIAVDCASIPESLIEAELFGYEEGAFTGARRKGTHGKILAANGGTLFLDEIGDMPLGLQTRLLRVLQERTVTPLGGNKEVPVNIAVTCATHRNLREMIQRGEFRQDLYYRLNGLVVRLPPLRDRCDITALVERIVSKECAVTKHLKVADDVLTLLRRYSWPGNVRQLANILRTAAVMAAEDGDTIRPQHLPDDFMEDVRGERLMSAPGCTTTEALDTLQKVAADAFDDSLPPPSPDTTEVSTETDGGSLKDMHVTAIRAALDQYAGNVSAAARALGVSRNTVYRALRARAESDGSS